MYLVKEGMWAEYQMRDGAYLLQNRKYEYLYFPKTADLENLFESKEEALQAAMDYHEEEGCKLYLELYPAPEKGDWDWIFQDATGEWYGCEHQPILRGNSWYVTNKHENDHEFLKNSPPNPFWRKTLI